MSHEVLLTDVSLLAYM